MIFREELPGMAQRGQADLDDANDSRHDVDGKLKTQTERKGEEMAE